MVSLSLSRLPTSCGGASVLVESVSKHVVGDVGDADLRLGSVDTDRSVEELHLVLLPGKDMLDGRPDLRSSPIGFRHRLRHRLALWLSLMDDRHHRRNGDRPFYEAFSPIFADKAWACSVSEVDWALRAFEGTKLGYLIGQAGFFHQGYRAVDDCLLCSKFLQRMVPIAGKHRLPNSIKPASALVFVSLPENSSFDYEGAPEGPQLSLVGWQLWSLEMLVS